MPCDPYTEADYFNTISAMAAEVEKGMADMVLMSITPTYPSTKYGYIVPEASNAGVYKVARFTEKPSVEVAEELLKHNAFRNGGVFAFKLGYITSIVDKYIEADSFSELHACYEELSNVSIGDVIVGNHVGKSKIFNELNIPVVCEAVKNFVVAASPDGILVCGIDHSENLKGLVEQIQNRSMYEERRWGVSCARPYQSRKWL